MLFARSRFRNGAGTSRKKIDGGVVGFLEFAALSNVEQGLLFARD
jgi:hypothetical protein